MESNFSISVIGGLRLLAKDRDAAQQVQARGAPDVAALLQAFYVFFRNRSDDSCKYR